MVEEREQLEGGNVALKLPGAKKGDLSKRSTKPEVFNIIFHFCIKLLRKASFLSRVFTPTDAIFRNTVSLHFVSKAIFLKIYR